MRGHYLLDPEEIRHYYGKTLRKDLKKKGALPHENVPGVVYLDPLWSDVIKYRLLSSTRGDIPGNRLGQGFTSTST